jgi:chemotaxis protein CheD
MSRPLEENIPTMPLPVTRTLFLRPGFLFLPRQPTRLCTVIASGVAVTVFDRARSLGGVGHYSHPRRLDRGSTPDFAAPALVGLIRMFQAAGSEPEDLETCLYGGADNVEAYGFEASGSDAWRGLANSRAGFDILARLGVGVVGSDVGGRFARKLIFHTGTGESLLAKVADADGWEWYPEPSARAGCA